jgi:hypothetical protein
VCYRYTIDLLLFVVTSASDGKTALRLDAYTDSRVRCARKDGQAADRVAGLPGTTTPPYEVVMQSQDNIVENWLPVRGYEGIYDVSNLGNVRTWRNGRWGTASEPRLLRPGRTKNGYMTVDLRTNGKPRTMYVHHLVMETFAGPRPEGLDVLHGQAGVSDNSRANLRWGTHSENMMDRVRDGTDNRGERHPLHKLSDGEVREIRKLLREGVKQTIIAEAFGIRQQTVSRIGSGKRRGHLLDVPDGAPN